MRPLLIQRLCTVLIFSIIALSLANAQDRYTVRRYTTGDGMPHNVPQCYTQDSTGMMWIGTRNGIARFDGMEFRLCKPANGLQLGTSRVRHLWASSAGMIWVEVYDYRLYLFDPNTRQFHNPLPEQQPAQRNKLFCFDRGVTYVLTDNRVLSRFDETDNRILQPGYEPVRITDNGASISAVWQDNTGREWVLGDSGVSLVSGGKLLRVSTTVYDKIWHSQGRLMLASKQGEVAVVSEGTQAPTLLKVGRCPTDFTDIRPQADGSFLIKTATAVWLCAPGGDTTAHPVPLFSGPTPADREMLMAGDGAFYAFTSTGDVARRDPLTGRTTLLSYPRMGRTQADRSQRLIHEDDCGQVWVLTGDGLLCRYDAETQQLVAATRHYGGEEQPYMVQARYMFADNHRNLWISANDGMDVLSFHRPTFQWVATPAPQGQSDWQNVRCVYEDSTRRLWVCTQGGRVETYDAQGRWTGNLTPDGHVVADRNRAFGARVYGMCEDADGRLWLGTRGDGIFVLSPAGHNSYAVRNYRQSADDPYSLSNNQVFAVCCDSRNRIWIGTLGGGLCLSVPHEGGWRFVHRGNDMKTWPAGGFNRIRCLSETNEGVMLVATTDGLVTFDANIDNLATATFYRNSMSSRPDSALNCNDIFHVAQDSHGRVLLSTTDGGVNVVKPGTNLLSSAIAFRHYGQKDGLLSDVVLATLEDATGRLWVVSPNSFTQWQPDSDNSVHLKPEFLKGQTSIGEAAPVVTADGNLIVGTTNGALKLLSATWEPSPIKPAIVFDGISIHSSQPYTKPVNDGSISLEPHERSFTAAFVALDYDNPANIAYAYRLDTSGPWRNIGNSRSVSFADMPPGDHTLQVRSTNGDGVWTSNAAQLTIHVVPTFRETGWAIALYALIAVCIILLSAGILVYIAGLRQKVVFEHQLTEMKLRFFTDISHELRTPLTLIAGPIDEVLETEQLSPNGQEIMQTARRNTNRMLKLVTQILDFRKLRNNKMRITLGKVDVEAVAHKVFLDFTAMAAQKGIHFTHQAAQQTCLGYADTDKLEKILFNLLSNAFKYTPNGRDITLITRREGDNYLMVVADQGKGFDNDQKDRLFLRFETDGVSGQLSTGIGLSLVKELVGLLHGRLDARSAKQQGSTFTVSLPINREAFATDDNVDWALTDTEGEWRDASTDSPTDLEPMTPTGGQPHADTTQPTDNAPEAAPSKPDATKVLIIEDNDELRHYIGHILGPEYEITEATNGQEGLERSRADNPDLVVCDIMMPVMDGIAYLNALKTDPATSHIPVLLLTAKTSIDDQIRGLEYGADDYLTKPFHTAFFRTKVATLLRRRRQLRDYYLAGNSLPEPTTVPTATDTRTSPDGSPNTPSASPEPTESKPAPSIITPQDNAFITKVIAGIESHIGDPDFKIDMLASAMNVSRSVFYRKIRGIMQMSPIDLVKTIRIRRVTSLMKEGELSVTEIAYRCGFSSPQYLSRLFKEMTGETPTEYMKRMQQEWSSKG